MLGYYAHLTRNKLLCVRLVDLHQDFFWFKVVKKSSARCCLPLLANCTKNRFKINKMAKIMYYQKKNLLLICVGNYHIVRHVLLLAEEKIHKILSKCDKLDTHTLRKMIKNIALLALVC